MSDMDDSDYYDSGGDEEMEAGSESGDLMSESDDDYAGFDHGADAITSSRKVRVNTARPVVSTLSRC